MKTFNIVLDPTVARKVQRVHPKKQTVAPGSVLQNSKDRGIV